MGGRGSQFNDRTKTIEDLLNSLDGDKQKQNLTYTDFGDVNKDFETTSHTDLTKSLKSDKIIVCDSLNNLDSEVAKVNLQQISVLKKQYSNFTNTFLDTENLKIRSYKVDDVSLITGKRKPNYSLVAAFHFATGQICLNERTNVDLGKVRQAELNSQNSNWSVRTDSQNVVKSTITHEFGHFVEDCIIEKRMQQDVHLYSKYRTASTEEHEEMRHAEAKKITTRIAEIALQKYNATKADLKLSQYAGSNQYEWFAETFTETNLHTTDKPLVKAMKDFLSEEGIIYEIRT